MGILFEIVVQQLAEQGIEVSAEAGDHSDEQRREVNEPVEEHAVEQSASSAEG